MEKLVTLQNCGCDGELKWTGDFECEAVEFDPADHRAELFKLEIRELIFDAEG